MLARILCLIMLFGVAGCAALDDGYTTHYGLTSTEYSRGRQNPAEETYTGGTVGIQEIEEYEEKYTCWNTERRRNPPKNDSAGSAGSSLRIFQWKSRPKSN